MSQKFEFWESERAAFAPPRKLDVAEWCNENIVLLAENSREPGPYRWQRTPYVRDILRLYQDPNIHHVVLKWGTQLGKTQILYNLLMYLIDQDPYSTMLIYPSDDEGRSVSRSRLQPLFRACEPVRKKIPSDPRQFQLDEMPFAGMILYVTGSNSPTPLSQKPVRNVFRDEINKWPPLISDYGDPMDLSNERFKTYYDVRKILDVSSPTVEGGNISRQEAQCQIILRYFVSCPFCHRLQTLDWEGIHFDDQKALTKVLRISVAKASARYTCKFCGRDIDDTYRDHLLDPANGAGWFDMDTEEPEPSRDSIGDLFRTFQAKGIQLESLAFRLSSLYSPWLRWGDIVGKFLEAHLADAKRFDKLRSFTTDWLGNEWIDAVEEKKDSDILKLRCEYPPLVVPSQAAVLTCGIDCQKHGFYFVVRAWGRDYTSWLIRYGYLLNFEDIFRLIHEDSYQVENTERRMKVWRASIDTGGGTDGDMSLTEQAYRFIAQYGGPGTFGVKGASREMIHKMKLTNIGTLPGTKATPIPGGTVRLWIVDTRYFKDVFHSRMEIKDGDPGALYLHNETGQDYASHITSEEKRRGKDGRYHWVHVRGQNHWLDCEIYASALVDPVCYGGLGVIANRKNSSGDNTQTQQPKPRHSGPLPGSWLYREKGGSVWHNR
jgi:phage terminase large subunit GpA-like protein